MKSVTILGSTGSIGVQALEVCTRLRFRVVALTAHSNAALLEQQARLCNPQAVALADEMAASELRIALADTSVKVLSGPEGVEECAAMQCDCVLNGIVGVAGLRPTMAALETGARLALANKESLVAGGALVMRYAHECNREILPVDSEHSAIFQCLGADANLNREQRSERAAPQVPERLILTASGGAFYGKTKDELERVTAAQALQHPTWRMGWKS